MAYNKNTSVNNILKYKKWWQDANEAGDENAKKYAENAAAGEYEKLKANGYADIANILGTSDYQAAKGWATSGKTKTRDYFYSLGKSYGLSNSEMDKIISYDDLTGDISIGGKNIGNADVTVDGISYWGDTSKLKSEFDDYIERSGTTRSKSLAVDQENESLFKKYNQEYEDLKNTNPFTTEEAKAILAKYDLAGLQGRDNVVASAGASNGGNIDSYAAANALRQQSALVNQGQMAVLEAHQQKIDNARALLSDMGVNIDRVFTQDETAKNNEVARQEVISGITGKVSDSVTKMMNNNIWNADGSLKNLEQDFSGQMSELETFLEATTDATQKANILEQLRLLEAARNQKIDEQGLPYSKTYKYQGQPDTEAGEQFNKTMEYNNNLLQSEIDLATGGSVKSPSSGNSKELGKLAIDDILSKWLYSPYGTDGVGSSYKGYDGTKAVQYIAAEKLKEFRTELAAKLAEYGYTAIQAENKVKEWSVNIAKQIATIERKDASDKDVITQIQKDHDIWWE